MAAQVTLGTSFSLATAYSTVDSLRSSGRHPTIIPQWRYTELLAVGLSPTADLLVLSDSIYQRWSVGESRPDPATL